MAGRSSRGPDRGAFRRRSTARVLAISGFILMTVWGLRYADHVGEAFRLAIEDGQSHPWGQVLNPWFIAGACPKALMLLLAAIVGFYLYLRRTAMRPAERLILELLSEPATKGRSRSRPSWAWIAAGLATVTAALTILEFIEPFYFVQDDSFSGVLPHLVRGCRLMAQGEFPSFNPCQLMGVPSGADSSFLYPPTFIAYCIARWGLGNEFYMLDAFAAMHLLAGFVASFAAARTAGLRPALALALGISFTLCGYVLLVGRGWNFVVAMVVWLPLLFCAMENWLNGRVGWRWLLSAGFAIGGFYYIGFPQIWFYVMLLLGFTAMVAVICGRIAARQLLWPLAATLLGLALLLPTLVVQLEISRGMAEKPANFGMGLEQGLLAALAPFPFTHAEGFMGLPANREPALQTQWYYAGTVVMACAYLSIGAMLAYRCRRAWLGQHPWTATAVVALWLGLGNEGLLWTFVGHLPVIHALNHHPHRLMPLFVFFCLIVGGIFLERLLRRGGSRKWEYVIAASTAVLMLYHISLARNSLWSYGDRPYPELPREIAARILPSENPQAGRVWSFGPFRSGLPGFAYTLPLGLPSAYGAYGFNGYDPVSEARPETLAMQEKFAAAPMEASRAYGIRWVLAANAEYYKLEREYWRGATNSDWCFDFSDSSWPSYRQKNLPAAELRFQREEVSLYELPDASPMAFDRAEPRRPLSIDFHGWGAEVQAPGNGPRKIVVNLADRPWLRAACGGQPLESSADDWGRMEVRVPDGVNHFEVFNQLPWRRGIFMALGLATATLSGMALIRKRI